MQSSSQRTQRQQQVQSTDATNSEADPSDSPQHANNGKFVQRVFDRFRHSLKSAGLFRRSNALMADSHNAEDQEPAETQTDKLAADGAGSDSKDATNPNGVAAAIKRAEKFYTVDTEAYDFKSVLDFYAKEDPRIIPKAMKFLIGRRSRPIGDADGGGAGCSVHPLLDKVALEFCTRLRMLEVARMPMCEERIFLWLGRDRAQRILGDIDRREEKDQMYFVNRVNLDHVLTDLQCLCTRLGGCVARDGQVYPAHCCTDPDKIREQHATRPGGPPPPRMAFVEQQALCSHVYLRQDFGIACEVKGCPNYGRRLCACFQLDMFIPDTIALATKRKFEEIRANFAKNIYGDQRWLLRASNLKGGNGVQLIDTAAELETFMRYDINRKMRGQFFVLQRYMKNPLLLDGRRFDIRMFLLIVVLTDRRVLAFLHPGYFRLAQLEFDPASCDLRRHLTWPFTWEPDYNRYNNKASATTNADVGGKQQLAGEVEDYCRPYAEACGSVGLPTIAGSREVDAAMRPGSGDGNRFLQRLGRIVHYLTGQMDSIVGDKPGSWQLFGLDLQVDADREVWLHDVMSYPCRGEPDPRSGTQNRLVPAVLTESLALVLELNQRDCATRRSAQWLDLPDVPVNQPGLIAAQKNFVWMYSTDATRLITSKPHRKRTKSPHWYQQWRVMEDLNDYILYLKNYRVDHFSLEDDTTLYGRQSFEHSPAEKFRKMMKTLRRANGSKAAGQEQSQDE